MKLVFFYQTDMGNYLKGSIKLIYFFHMKKKLYDEGFYNSKAVPLDHMLTKK